MIGDDRPRRLPSLGQEHALRSRARTAQRRRNSAPALSVTNNTGEIITAAAPAVTDPFFVDLWSCGRIDAKTTCKTGPTDLRFFTDLALVNGTNRISRSVTLTYTGATTSNTYTTTVTFTATQHAQR